MAQLKQQQIMERAGLGGDELEFGFSMSEESNSMKGSNAMEEGKSRKRW